MRTLMKTSTHLLLPALLAASVLTAVRMPASEEPPVASPAVDGVLQTIRVWSTSEHGVPRPGAMTWSPRLDALVLADADRPGVRRAVMPDETDLGRVPETTAPAAPAPSSVVGLEGHDLRGRSVHPETGEVFTYDATTGRLVALRGRSVAATYDASDLSVEDVRGVVLAPSGDSTDHPSELSVYVVDHGAPGNFGEVVEATFASDVELVADVTPSAVRAVATSSYSPPSPDPSGVAYIPGTDRLMIVDGEVDEMSIFRNANMYTTTRLGALQSTGVSQPWSDEPVGVGYNPTNNHLFVSDDDDKEVAEIVAGGDGRFGTSDDTVTEFNVEDEGVADPEGIDYDVGDQLAVVRRGRGRRPAPGAGRHRRALRHQRRRVVALGRRRLRRPGPRGHGVRPGARHGAAAGRQLRDDLRARPQRRAAEHHRRQLRERRGRWPAWPWRRPPPGPAHAPTTWSPAGRTTTATPTRTTAGSTRSPPPCRRSAVARPTRRRT